MEFLVGKSEHPQEFALHQKYATCDRLFELVWMHGIIINDVAHQLFAKLLDKTGIVEPHLTQAALLHDIGVYNCGGFDWIPEQPPSTRPYAQHTIVGAWILHQEGYSPEVIQVANVHAGVGLTSDDISQHNLDLPLDDYLPTTPLHEFMTYAAKFHSKTPRLKNRDEIIESLSKFGEDKVERFLAWEQKFGQPDIENLEEKYKGWHTQFKQKIDAITNPTVQGLSSAGISRFVPQTNPSPGSQLNQ